jgi:hypothetical protein
MKMKVFYLIALIIMTLGCWVAATLYWGFVGPSELIVIITFGWLLLLPLAMAVRSINYSVWVFAALLILVALFLPAPIFVKFFPIQDGDPLGIQLAFTLLAIFSIALIVLALLLNSGLRLYRRWKNAEEIVGAAKNGDSEAQRKQTGRAAAAVLTLGFLLLVRALDNFYWFMVWDSTGDGLGYLWLPIPILVVLSSTFILFIVLPEKGKLPAFLFLLLIPAMIAITAGAQRVDFRQLTEKRGARVNQAIEAFYTQKGHYPRNLRQLTPKYALSIPGPVIIYGQEWCYDGGEDYYRLGYIDREHWSAPHFIGRIYQTKGEVPDLYGMCEQEAVALQKRHPDYPYKYWVAGE